MAGKDNRAAADEGLLADLEERAEEAERLGLVDPDAAGKKSPA